MRTGTSDLSIPLSATELGVEGVDRSILEQISRSIALHPARLRNTVASILEREPIPDFKGERSEIDIEEDHKLLRQNFHDMALQVIGDEKLPSLHLSNVPSAPLIPDPTTGKRFISPLREKQINQALRDLCLEIGNGKSVPEQVKAILERGHILDRNPRPRTFVWGGHRTQPLVYKYSKTLGYWDAVVNQTEFTTGSGPGIMKAPFSGSIPAYLDRGITHERNAIGFSEPGIITAERPNARIDELFIFPDISKRIIAFIAANHRGRIEEGGVGTGQEMLSFLSIMSHGNNKKIEYPCDALGISTKSIVHQYKKFLEAFFKRDEIKKYFKFHFGKAPDKFAEYVARSNKSLDFSKLYHDDIDFPEHVWYPTPASFDAIEQLNFSPENHNISTLAKEIEKLFNFYVELTVVAPEQVDSWGKDRPLLKGERTKVRLITNLIDRMIAEKRLFAPQGQRLFRTGWE